MIVGKLARSLERGIDPRSRQAGRDAFFLVSLAINSYLKVVLAMPASTSRRSGLIKALILVGFIVAALALVRFTGIREFLTVDKLGAFLAAAGIWAPLTFILIYAVGV